MRPLSHKAPFCNRNVRTYMHISVTKMLRCGCCIMGLLSDTYNCGLHRRCDPDMHYSTCVTHVPWCMPGSLTTGFLWSRRRAENVPGILGACATRNFTYLVRDPWDLCNSTIKGFAGYGLETFCCWVKRGPGCTLFRGIICQSIKS